MAQQFTPQMEPRCHPLVSSQFREDQMMKRNGLKKRSTHRGYSLRYLKDKVGEHVYGDWNETVPHFRRNRKEPFVDYIMNQQVMRWYVCIVHISVASI